MIIILVGFMGVGKTTYGKKLASNFGYEFVDLDKYIENKHKATIPFIFNLIGEHGFRIIEHRSLIEVLQKDNIILSTGGGTPCFFDNMEIITRKGFSIYLQLNPEVILHRLSNSKKKRPLIEKLSEQNLLDFIKNQLSEREKYYNLAKIKIDALNLSIKELAEKIKNNNDFSKEFYEA